MGDSSVGGEYDDAGRPRPLSTRCIPARTGFSETSKPGQAAAPGAMIEDPRRPFVATVILCTHNPQPQLFAWALRSLQNQTCDMGQVQVIIVDSGSAAPLPLSPERLAGLNVEVVREDRPGLTLARTIGIRHARAQLLIFIDDDNHIDEDFIANALVIAADHAHIGCFGGRIRPRSRRPIPGWKTPALPYLAVRDYGDEAITSNADTWGEWEPVGAGLVVRYEVATKWAAFVESNEFAQRLGRKGSQLLSGEDSLFSRLAYRLGYYCSYQPSLKLQHYMPARRLAFRSICQNLLGQGRSYVILNAALGVGMKPPGAHSMAIEMLGRARYHLRRRGVRLGLAMIWWDIGYFYELRCLTIGKRL